MKLHAISAKWRNAERDKSALPAMIVNRGEATQHMFVRLIAKAGGVRLRIAEISRHWSIVSSRYYRPTALH